MRTSRTRVTQIAAALVGAVLLVGVSMTPAVAAPTPPDDHNDITYPHDYVYPPLWKLDTTVPEFKLPGCEGLLSPRAASLFGTGLTLETPSDDGTRSEVISAIVADNGGTICAWREGKTKNYIHFSVTPISEAQRFAIIADWETHFGTSGLGVGGRNLILHSGTIRNTESAMLLEEGLYITANPVDGTMFPAFIQAQGDHLYYLTH